MFSNYRDDNIINTIRSFDPSIIENILISGFVLNDELINKIDNITKDYKIVYIGSVLKNKPKRFITIENDDCTSTLLYYNLLYPSIGNIYEYMINEFNKASITGLLNITTKILNKLSYNSNNYNVLKILKNNPILNESNIPKFYNSYLKLEDPKFDDFFVTAVNNVAIFYITKSWVSGYIKYLQIFLFDYILRNTNYKSCIFINASNPRGFSLRTNREDIDLRDIVQKYNGTGYKRAAGFLSYDAVDMVERENLLTNNEIRNIIYELTEKMKG